MNKKKDTYGSNITQERAFALGSLLNAAGDLLETRGGADKVMSIMTTKLMTPSQTGVKKFYSFNMIPIKELTIAQMKALTKKCQEAMPKTKK